MQPLLERLMTAFPDAIRAVEVDTIRHEVTARVAAARIVEVARWLHDTPDASFDHITDICSVDYPDDPERFEVVYHLLSLPHRRRIRLKARVTVGPPLQAFANDDVAAGVADLVESGVDVHAEAAVIRRGFCRRLLRRVCLYLTEASVAQHV